MTIQFGTFTLDDSRRQVVREGGAEVHLSVKAYEFLKLLLQERPRVVKKEELHQRLWPDTFVSEAALLTVVAEVRAALGEPARTSTLIRTVHRVGYAFAVEAREVATSAAQQELVRTGTPGNRPGASLSDERSDSQPLGQTMCWIAAGGRRYPLHEGANVLGRDERAAIQIDAQPVSRQHASIVLSDGTATLADLGSNNRTYVRGVRVSSPVALHDGDEIRLGTIVLTFRTLVAPGSTALLA